MIEEIILGTIQGIAEWLPVSSEGLIVLTKANFFPDDQGFAGMIRIALFLHFGTFLAALIYFFKDVKTLIAALFHYKSQTEADQKLIQFLIISTLISGIIGLLLLKGLAHMLEDMLSAGRITTLCVGLLLLITAYLQLRSPEQGHRHIKDINLKDSVILGIVQGFAALPGLSRSGLTVSALLLRNLDKEYALKLSFLMSLPIVLAGNIVLHIKDLHFSLSSMVGLFFSFLFGLLTIHLLLKLAQKVNFGLFVLFFAVITIIAAMI